MENLQNVEVTNNQQYSGDVDYISALNEMKKNSVPVEKYDKLLAEQKKLLEAYCNGMPLSSEEQPEKKSIEELRECIFDPMGDNELNLNYIKNVLELREEIMANGGTDPFLPHGYQDYDIATASRVAAAFQHCIDYEDGDPQVFTNELQRITLNDSAMYYNR